MQGRKPSLQPDSALIWAPNLVTQKGWRHPAGVQDSTSTPRTEGDLELCTVIVLPAKQIMPFLDAE